MTLATLATFARDVGVALGLLGLAAPGSPFQEPMDAAAEDTEAMHAEPRPGVGAEKPWRVGEPLPALRLPTLDGRETVPLRELAGARPLLLVEFASW